MRFNLHLYATGLVPSTSVLNAAELAVADCGKFISSFARPESLGRYEMKYSIEFKVMQVIDDDSMLIQATVSLPNGGDDSPEPFMLHGLSTFGIIDNAPINLDGKMGLVRDTERYITVLGSSKTVFAVTIIDPVPYEEEIVEALNRLKRGPRDLLADHPATRPSNE